LALLLSSLAALLAITPRAAEAQIDNNSPSSPVASAVDCIRAGVDMGQASFASPRFAVTCFPSAWSRSTYNYDTGDPIGDAPKTYVTVKEFGDSAAEGPSTTGHLSRAAAGNGGSAASDMGVGAVYGVAYSSGTNPAATAAAQANRLFVAAYVKKMTRFGYGGPGAIYVLNRETNAERLFVQVPAVIPGPSAAQAGAAGYPNTPGDGSRTTWPSQAEGVPYSHEMGGIHGYDHDGISQNYVGTVGLGDIEMDRSERYLGAVNLNDRKVYIFDTWNGTGSPLDVQASMSTFTPDPNVAACPGGSGNFRPFTLKWDAYNQFYIGYVCSAQTTLNRDDLRAGVLRWAAGANGIWALTKVFETPLTTFDGPRSVLAQAQWQPWQPDTKKVQPILSDFEFAEDGSLILALRDRTADQTGNQFYQADYGNNEGDILRALPNGSGSWIAPGAAEYFSEDNSTHDAQPETAQGATAYIPGTHAGVYGGEVLSTLGQQWQDGSGNAGWFNISSGARTAREELYADASAPYSFSKAGGLGDVELLCIWRAVGNRVWKDANGNGVQDAGETDIAGVRLQVLDVNGNALPGTLAGLAVTTGTVTGPSDQWRVYLSPFQSYQIRIDPAMFNAGQPLAGLSVTVQDSSAANGNDAIDSDANASGVIAIGPGYRSEVNTSYDIGLTDGADVQITKTGPATAALGSSFSFTLAWRNNGPGSAQNVSVSDTIPAGLTYVSAVPAPSSISGSTLTWNYGSQANGASGTITVNVTVSATTSVQNCATISTSSALDAAGNNTSCSTPNIQTPNVTIAKTAPATAVVGGSLSYGLTVQNIGTAAANDVMVSDTLPSGLTYVSAVPAPSSISGSTLTWSLGQIAAGGSRGITINTTALTSAPATVQNCAAVSTSSPGDPAGDNNSCTNSLIQRPNVTITKTGPTTVTAGEGMAYTLTYRNTGDAPAATVQVRDTLPAGVTYVSANPAPSSVSGQVLTWNFGTLLVGANATITLNVTVAATVANGTVVTNSTTISTTSSGDDPSDNTSSTNTTVQWADVAVVKTSPQSFPVAEGSTVTYYLDYRNNGPALARGVTLQDTVPSQLTNVSWSCTNGCTGTGTGNAISVTIGDVAANVTGRITVTGTARTTLARESFTNTVTVATSTVETSTTNNTSSLPGEVWTADVAIVKDAAVLVVAGNTFTATLTYRNNGPAPAAGVSLMDTLPSGVTFVSSTPAPTSQSGQTLTWNLGSLAASASGQIALTLRSSADIALNTVLTNRATISTTSTDRDSSNNTDTADTGVRTEADLQIDKTGPGTVAAGNSFLYSLSYRNNGPSRARVVAGADVLPAGTTFISAVPSPSSISGQTVSWDLGELSPGMGGTITVRVQADASTLASSVVTNRANITTSTRDVNPANNTDTHDTIVETSDIRVTKDMPATVTAGEIFNVTITVENLGPALAPGVQLNDPLPLGATYMSSTPSPMTTGSSLSWILGDMAAGEKRTVTMQLRAAANLTDGSNLPNTAASPVDISDRDGTNNQGSDTSAVRVNADLRVEKSGPAGPLPSGTATTYTLRYANDGPSLARAVVLQDTLPAGFRFERSTPAPTTISGATLTWNLGDLAPAGGVIIVVEGTLETSAPVATYTNRATIGSSSNDDDPADNEDTVDTDVWTADVSVVKTARAASVAAGTQLTYDLVVTNAGPLAATAAELVDTLPSAATFVSAEPAPSSISGSGLTWDLGDLAADQTVNIALTVRVDTDALGDMTNLAVVSFDEQATRDRDLANNRDDAVTPVVDEADVAIVKDGPTGPLPTGSQLVYTIDYRNNGPALARNVQITDALPAGVVFESASPAPSGQGGKILTWDIGTMAPNASGRITVTGRATTALDRETLRNAALIETSSTDPNDGNNTDTADTELHTADVSVVKAPRADTIVAGTQLTYDLVVSNSGPLAATGVRLDDTLPDTMRFVSADPAPAAQVGQALTWDIGALAGGETRTIALTVAVSPSAKVEVVNTAVVSFDDQPTLDRDPGNNTDTATIPVTEAADVSVVKGGPAGPLPSGSVITYTLTFGNAGPSTAENVVLTDELPAAFTLIRTDREPDQTDGATLSWNLGSLAPGETGVVTLVGRVNTSQPSIQVQNTAATTGSTLDLDDTNNTDSTQTEVQTADVSVVKTAAAAAVIAGEEVVYNLEVSNAGLLTATVVEVTDTLPAGTSFVSAQPAPARVSGQDVVWALGNLGVNERRTIAVRVRVAPETTGTLFNVAAASFEEQTDRDRDPSNNSDDHTLPVNTLADTGIVKTAAAVPAVGDVIPSGSVITYTLTYTNAGPSLATGVVVTDTMPPGFTFQSASVKPTATTTSTLTWNLGDVPVGQPAKITVTGILRAVGSAHQVNVANIAGEQLDPDPTDNEDDHPIDLELPDLRVTKDNGVTSVQPGDLLIYTVTVENVGKVAVSGVVVTETPLAGVTVAATGWTRQSNGTWTFTVGAMAPGATRTLTFGYQVPNPVPAAMVTAGDVVNLVRVADDGSNGPDKTPDDNSDEDRDLLLSGTVGDLIWLDTDGDGQKDAEEPGLGNMPLELLDSSTMAVLARLTTDANGGYSFGGLKLGSYAIRIDPATLQEEPWRAYRITTEPIPVAALTPNQQSDMTLDIGLYNPTPTSVVLAYLKAERQEDQSVKVRWGTLSEDNTDRFIVKRTAGATLGADAVVVGTVDSKGSAGGDYSLMETGAPADAHYWLVEVELDGSEHVYGPVKIEITLTGQVRVFLPMVRR
jgi:uncharacterized repeat protein (TIGR01451 family)